MIFGVVSPVYASTLNDETGEQYTILEENFDPNTGQNTYSFTSEDTENNRVTRGLSFYGLPPVTPQKPWSDYKQKLVVRFELHDYINATNKEGIKETLKEKFPELFSEWGGIAATIVYTVDGVKHTEEVKLTTDNFKEANLDMISDTQYLWSYEVTLPGEEYRIYNSDGSPVQYQINTDKSMAFVVQVGYSNSAGKYDLDTNTSKILFQAYHIVNSEIKLEYKGVDKIDDGQAKMGEFANRAAFLDSPKRFNFSIPLYGNQNTILRDDWGDQKLIEWYKGLLIATQNSHIADENRSDIRVKLKDKTTNELQNTGLIDLKVNGQMVEFKFETQYDIWDGCLITLKAPVEVTYDKNDVNAKWPEGITDPVKEKVYATENAKGEILPTLEGKTFAGWSSTKGGPVEAGVLENIEADKTVYAVYTEKPIVSPEDPHDSGYVKVHFDSVINGKFVQGVKNSYWVLKGKTLQEAQAYAANPLVIPEVTPNENFEHIGWNDGIREDNYDKLLTEFKEELKKDIRFTAQYKDVKDIIGPVDPGEKPNPDEEKYWTVTFKSADIKMGEVAKQNTYYVLKTAGKTLADVAAPPTIPAKGYRFDKWVPTPDKSISIDRNIEVLGYFIKDDSLYAKIKFEGGTKGTLEGTTTFEVLKGKKLTESGITIPIVKEDPNFEHIGWENKNKVYDKLLENYGEPVEDDLIFVAKYSTAMGEITGFNKNGITALKIIQQPRLSYMEGENLDLSELKVRLTDDKGMQVDVQFAEFGEYGINTNPVNGTKLTLEDNGKQIDIVKDNISVKTDPLIVNKIYVPQPQEELKVHFVIRNEDSHKGYFVENQNISMITRLLPNPYTTDDLVKSEPRVFARMGYKFLGWDKTLRGSSEDNITYYAVFSNYDDFWNIDFIVRPEVPAVKGELLIMPSAQMPKTETEETELHKAYLKGYPDRTVRPRGNITRAEAAALVARLENLDLSDGTKSTFKDVKDNAWYLPYINAVVKKDLLLADEERNIRPDEPITRAEFARMLAPIDKKNQTASNFADIKGHKYEAAINQEYGNGVIEGYEDQTFRPEGKITRAETAAMLNRKYDRVADPEAIPSYLIDKLTKFPDLSEAQWYYYDLVEATNTHRATRRNTKDKYGRNYESWKEILPAEVQ